MFKSVRLVTTSLLTPSAYSKQVNLWCEKDGLTKFAGSKFELLTYTFSVNLPSNNENCQK